MKLSELRTFPTADDETREKIVSYIEGIRDPQTRQMFELHFLRGLSYKQVANMLGGGVTRYCIYRRVKRYVEKH